MTPDRTQRRIPRSTQDLVQGTTYRNLVDEPQVSALEPSQCWAMLRTTDRGRLAVVVDGRPEIFPVTYVVDRGTVVFRTAPGTKLTALRDHPEVALEADGSDPGSGQTWSVVLHGTTTEIAGLHELIEVEDLYLVPAQAGPRHHFVRVEPSRVTGRRFVARTTAP